MTACSLVPGEKLNFFAEWPSPHVYEIQTHSLKNDTLKSRLKLTLNKFGEPFLHYVYVKGARLIQPGGNSSEVTVSRSTCTNLQGT